jgi:hypothetical protein
VPLLSSPSLTRRSRLCVLTHAPSCRAHAWLSVSDADLPSVGAGRPGAGAGGPDLRCTWPEETDHSLIARPSRRTRRTRPDCKRPARPGRNYRTLAGPGRLVGPAVGKIVSSRLARPGRWVGRRSRDGLQVRFACLRMARSKPALPPARSPSAALEAGRQATYRRSLAHSTTHSHTSSIHLHSSRYLPPHSTLTETYPSTTMTSTLTNNNITQAALEALKKPELVARCKVRSLRRCSSAFLHPTPHPILHRHAPRCSLDSRLTRSARFLLSVVPRQVAGIKTTSSMRKDELVRAILNGSTAASSYVLLSLRAALLPFRHISRD